jgi:hypothetical protein
MTMAAPPRLDIVIPVHNEGANILQTLRSIARDVKTPLRVLICYDREDDDTLSAISRPITWHGCRRATSATAFACSRGA